MKKKANTESKKRSPVRQPEKSARTVSSQPQPGNNNRNRATNQDKANLKTTKQVDTTSGTSKGQDTRDSSLLKQSPEPKSPKKQDESYDQIKDLRQFLKEVVIEFRKISCRIAIKFCVKPAACCSW